MLGTGNLLVRRAVNNFVRNHSHGGIPGEVSLLCNLVETVKVFLVLD